MTQTLPNKPLQGRSTQVRRHVRSHEDKCCTFFDEPDHARPCSVTTRALG